MALTSSGPSGFPSVPLLVLDQLLLQVFSSTTLSHYHTLQVLSSQFQQMTFPPLLRKLMLLDMLGILVKVLCYKQQNPICWLNAMFVKSYFVVQRISKRTSEPA